MGQFSYEADRYGLTVERLVIEVRGGVETGLVPPMASILPLSMR